MHAGIGGVVKVVGERIHAEDHHGDSQCIVGFLEVENDRNMMSDGNLLDHNGEGFSVCARGYGRGAVHGK